LDRKVRGKTISRQVFTRNDKVVRLSFYIERDLDLKLTTLAKKKRILKSDLFNQLLKLSLELGLDKETKKKRGISTNFKMWEE